MIGFLRCIVFLCTSIAVFAADEQRDRHGADPLDQGADNCPATVIAALPYADSGTTAGRADNFSFCLGQFSPDVVYEFTPSETALYSFVVSSNYLAVVALNSGGACPGNTQVYCFQNSAGNQGVFDTQLAASTTYYLIIDGQIAAGSYTISVSQTCITCEADSCPATLIPSLPYTDDGTTIGRANDFNSYYCGGQNAPDVIYRMTLSTTQNVVASLTNETLPYLHSLALRSGSTCPGTNVECNFGGNYGIGASISFRAEAGTTYYFVIDNSSTHDGDYTLNVSPVCTVTAQPGDLTECAETPGPSHAANDCNGGCYNEFYGGVATFLPYTCGQTYFGQMFTFRINQPLTDRDWFRFDLAQPCSLAVTVTAEFPWTVYVKQAICEPTWAHYYWGSACSTITEIEHSSPFHVLPAGSYEMWIESQQDTAMPDPLHYRLRVDNFPVCGEDGAIATLPGSYSSNTCGEGDDCTLDLQQQVDTDDRLVRVDIPEHGSYTFSLCSSASPWTSKMTLMTTCCDNSPFIIAQSNSGCVNGLAQLECIELDSGKVFVLVENDGNEGPPFCTDNFTLTVEPCPCPPIDSLTIEPFEDFSVFLNFYVPTPGLVKFYYSTTPEVAYPSGFTLVDQFQANTSGRINDYEIAAPGQTGIFVATLSGCQQ